MFTVTRYFFLHSLHRLVTETTTPTQSSSMRVTMYAHSSPTLIPRVKSTFWNGLLSTSVWLLQVKTNWSKYEFLLFLTPRSGLQPPPPPSVSTTTTLLLCSPSNGTTSSYIRMPLAMTRSSLEVLLMVSSMSMIPKPILVSSSTTITSTTSLLLSLLRKPVYSLAVSNNKHYFASASADHYIYIYNTTVYHLTCSSEGRLMSVFVPLSAMAFHSPLISITQVTSLLSPLPMERPTLSIYESNVFSRQELSSRVILDFCRFSSLCSMFLWWFFTLLCLSIQQHK